MSLDYTLGKDAAEIREALRRIEAKLGGPTDAVSTPLSQGLNEPPVGAVRSPVMLAYEPVPHKRITPESQRLAPIAWKATDVTNSRRVPTPDRSAEVSFFAFMLPAAEINVTVPATIADSIFPEVQRLYDADVSAKQLYYYRPTGFRGYTCVFGDYIKSHNWWFWMAVEFSHSQDNPNARFSRSYNMRGEFVFASNGWVTQPVNLGVGAYKYNVPYADCDRKEGLGFSFQDFYQ